jgi:2-polyprenyl-3-methyl-5-hydroxy-6-metoxy-1,4-benzoquinol methylase
MTDIQEINQSSIQQFVERSDELGGPSSPECATYWAGLHYAPMALVDKQCDPLSVAYYNQQMALYREMTGHDYQELDHEFTPGVPIESLLAAPNAYGFMAPHEYARHCVAMGWIVQRLGLLAEHSVLELGSGWGFCQEFLAGCGLQSKGIDVNPDFVRTSNQRLERLGFGSRAQLASFGKIGPNIGLFDIVMSYEAFHHAVDPLSLLMKSVTCLKPNGRIVLAAEPFNEFYHTWGLRLDPYSVYCIHKFGWFESGWSAEYMAFLFAIAGLDAEFIDMPLSDLTRYMIGTPSERVRAFQLGLWHPDVKTSVTRDGENFFCTPDTKILVPIRSGSNGFILDVENFSLRSLKVKVDCLDKRQVLTFPPGKGTIPVELCNLSSAGAVWMTLESEMFCPAQQGINEDTRSLGIQVYGLNYNTIGHSA